MDKKAVLGIIVGLMFVFNICLVTFKKKEYHIPLRIPNQTQPIKPIADNKPQQPKQELEKVPVFIDVPIISSRVNEKSLYADIMNRARNPFTRESRPTNAHETVHDINSMIRNSHLGSGGFYVLNGKGVVIQNPKMRKSAIAAFIPPSLRGSRYQLYIKESPDWEDTPLYILDEFVAYISNGAVAVDDKKNGREVPRSDELCGSIEFSFYATALAMAIEKNDPEYWNSNEQFKNFMAWILKRAKEVYDSGKDMPEFPSSSQAKLEQNIKTSPDAEEMRQFLKKHFNGIWVDK